MSLDNLARGLFDFALPNRCIACSLVTDSERTSVPLCKNHRQSIATFREPVCYFCSRPLSGGLHRHYEYEISDEPICGSCRKRSLVLERMVAGFPFRDILRSVVSDWKYRSNPVWVSWLADRLYDATWDQINETEWDVLVPVPMHRRHRRERGFNQATQLGEALGERTGLKMLNVLSKVRRTRRQSELTRDERLRNLEGAFALDEEELPSSVRSVLLVDDVYTTGTTLRTAARVLLNKGITTVGGLVLARTLPQY